MRVAALFGILLSAHASATYLLGGGISGSWQAEGRQGEGLVIHQVDNRQLLVNWFTYDAQGNQLWLVGSGLIEGTRTPIADLWRTRGPRFGVGYQSGDLTLHRFGAMELEFTGCQRLVARWSRAEPPMAEGLITFTRLTELDGVACAEQVSPLRQANWDLAMESGPTSVSYAATAATSEGVLYLAGGANQDGYTEAFHRRSPVGEWQALAPLPEARIGAAAVIHAGGFYFFGGAGYTGFGGGPNCVALICGEVTGVGFRRRDAWRYDLQDEHWRELPPMPQSANMGGAVVLDGVIWVLDGWTTNLLRFDPVAQSWSTHEGPGVGPRAQSALVALDGELWMIGGRTYSDEQRDVHIYSPQAQRWRQGPILRHARAGHSAIVVAGQIVVSGGERWFEDRHLLASSEVFAPGQGGWLDLDAPRIPVHGASTYLLGPRVIQLGGSTVPRRAVTTPMRQSFPLPP